MGLKNKEWFVVFGIYKDDNYYIEFSKDNNAYCVTDGKYDRFINIKETIQFVYSNGSRYRTIKKEELAKNTWY